MTHRDPDLFDGPALRLLHRLHDELDGERRAALERRQEVRERLNAGEVLDYLRSR